jgi:hypothetical protein
MPIRLSQERARLQYLERLSANRLEKLNTYSGRLARYFVSAHHEFLTLAQRSQPNR